MATSVHDGHDISDSYSESRGSGTLSLKPKEGNRFVLVHWKLTALRPDPKAADALFLLGYQYLTCNHKDASYKTFKRVVALQPADTIAAEYANMTAPESKSDTPIPHPPESAIPADKLLSAKDVVGNWVAKSTNNTTFTLLSFLLGRGFSLLV